MPPALSIAFNSIVPTHLATPYLAFRELKGYLAHHGMPERVSCTFHTFLLDTPAAEAAAAITAPGCSLAAFSVHLWNEQETRALCRELKTRAPATLTILGGPCATFLADELREGGTVDLIVEGPGEEVFRQLVAALLDGSDWAAIPGLSFWRNGKVVRTSPNPGFDVAQQTYALPVAEGTDEFMLYEISRGCPFRCRYCAWSGSDAEPLRFYPRAKIERDLRAIFETERIQYLGFCDSNFFLDKALGLWTLRTMAGLNRERRDRGWKETNIIAELNPELINDEIMEEIAQCPEGFMFSCGLQTLDEEVNRKHLNRAFHRDKYLANLRKLNQKAFHLLNVEIIYGLPGETYEGFMRTVEFVLSDLRVRRFAAFHFLVIPGSWFREHAEECHLIYDPKPPYRLIRSDTFPEADVERAKQFVFFIYLFFYMLREVRQLVNERFPAGHVPVYERIIEHFRARHPEFIETYYQAYEEPNFTPVFEKHYNEIMAKKPDILAGVSALLSNTSTLS